MNESANESEQARKIEYPQFLIPHGGGYLSIVNPDDDTTQMLVVCSERELAMRLIYQFELMSAPKELANDREFVWLLRSIKKPVCHVVFDPRPVGEAVNAVEVASIESLLSERLRPDMSPWNYPVFAIASGEGFVSIASEDETGKPIQLLCFFSEQELAQQYLEAAGETGEQCKLANVAEARTFLSSLDREMAVAVALDPAVENGVHTAKYCFSIEVLLEKYLVGESAGN